MRFAIVGGGISGLAAAWDLSGHAGAEVTVFEPGRIGGKLLTSEFDGHPVDEGPDAFLVRTPEATSLCAELGIDDLVPPAAGRTLLWARGRLRPIPDGLVLGVPGRLGPVVRSGLLTPTGMLRAGLDLVLPRSSPAGDVSVGSLVRARFGGQVAERLVEPLLGGIHAAPVDELSTAVVAPHVLAAARSSRSLLLGLRRAAAGGPAGGRGPVFLAPRGGMGVLASRLEQALRDRGVRFSGAEVSDLAAMEDPAGVAITASGATDRFEAAVVAVPAPVAARLLGRAAPAGLADIAFTSVAVLTVAVPGAQWTPPAGFNGVLVTAGERRLMTACSFFTNKWPGNRPAGGASIVRVSAGRFGDGRVDELDDGELTGRLIAELGRAVGVPITPVATRLSRWPGSFPLYRVGHAETVERIGRELGTGTAGRVALAGSSYGGAGVPACVRSGRLAAEAVRAATSR